MKVNEKEIVVNYLSKPDPSSEFESLYFKVRSKENRILSDALVKQLPYLSNKESKHYKEWKVRAHSFEQLQNYFSNKKSKLSVMDLGCGNGWTSAGLAKNDLLSIAAVDLNLEEIKQAARIFVKPNLTFCYGNVFEDVFPTSSFDVIILNACIQYFENLPELISRLFYFLNPGGEIHILDTPFYSHQNIEAAKQRTLAYYTSIGFPQMAKHYFHHNLNDLKEFECEILSDSNYFLKRFKTLTVGIPSEFKCIRIFTP